MLFNSGNNLESETIKFLDNNNSIVAFSAYIKLNELKKINASKHIRTIVVRWEIKDLCLGVSDMELYDYCKRYKIVLYRNPRLHLKAFWNFSDKVLYGSANITKKGLGEEMNYNYELNGVASDISFESIVYFNHIISNSELITEERYREIKAIVEQNKITLPKMQDLSVLERNENKYLLSDLPMSKKVNQLYSKTQKIHQLSILEKGCLAHDLALFGLNPNHKRELFYQNLKKEFNNHPFIKALKNHIKNSRGHSINYGGVVRWIQQKTTTVPIPRSWEIKRDEIVNILFDWICFCDYNFKWDRPNHSQVIYYKPKNLKLEKFINDLNRDSVRGNIAPHQLVLLITFLRMFDSTIELFSFKELHVNFNKVWEELKLFFKTGNRDIIMPIKALTNQGHIKLHPNNEIYKSLHKVSDFEKYYKSVSLHQEFKEILSLPDVENYLIKRLQQEG